MSHENSYDVQDEIFTRRKVKGKIIASGRIGPFEVKNGNRLKSTLFSYRKYSIKPPSLK